MVGVPSHGSVASLSELRKWIVTSTVNIGTHVPQRAAIWALRRHGPTPVPPHVADVHVLASDAHPVAFASSTYQFGTLHEAGGTCGAPPPTDIFAVGLGIAVPHAQFSFRPMVQASCMCCRGVLVSGLAFAPG